jgi:hypothetical protein
MRSRMSEMGTFLISRFAWREARVPGNEECPRFFFMQR